MKSKILNSTTHIARKNHPRMIGIMAGADLYHFFYDLGHELKQMIECKIVIYGSDDLSLRSYERYVRDGVADDLVAADVIHREALRTDLEPQVVYRRALEMEAYIDCSYGEILMSRRDLGRAFALGGFYHPRSETHDKCTHLQVTHGLTEQLNFWKNEIQKRNLDLIVNGLKEAAVMARAMGIEYRQLYNSRVDNYWYWSPNEFVEFPDVKAKYERLEGATFPPVVLTEPYFTEVMQQKRLQSQTAGRLALRKFGGSTLGYFYRRLKGVAPGYGLRERWRWIAREWWQKKQLSARGRTKTLAEVKGEKFVFFPLHTEPEMTLQWFSPENFFQLACIAAIARDLPSDTFLVVKESVYGVGRRPLDFYEQISDFRNVELLDINEKGVDVIRESAGVITISGSAGLEAALMGKPVIIFGQHNYYDFLDHVRIVSLEAGLREAFLWALGSGFDRDKAVRDGARLREAVVQTAFNLKSWNNVFPDTYDRSVVSVAARALIESYYTSVTKVEQQMAATLRLGWQNS